MPATWSPMTMDATANQARRARRSQRPRKVVDGGEGRGFIPPIPRLCSLVPSATTPLYRRLVSQALRNAVRESIRTNFLELRKAEVQLRRISLPKLFGNSG